MQLLRVPLRVPFRSGRWFLEQVHLVGRNRHKSVCYCTAMLGQSPGLPAPSENARCFAGHSAKHGVVKASSWDCGSGVLPKENLLKGGQQNGCGCSGRKPSRLWRSCPNPKAALALSQIHQEGSPRADTAGACTPHACLAAVLERSARAVRLG